MNPTCLYSIFVLGIVFLLAGCAPQPSPPIHFQLPAGYVGVFALMLDSTNGISVGITNGKYTYIIPTNGVLRVKTFDPFTQPHTESASYAGGNLIPMDVDSPSNVVACRQAGDHEDQESSGQWVRCLAYVIGTEAKKLEAEEKRQWQMLKP